MQAIAAEIDRAKNSGVPAFMTSAFYDNPYPFYQHLQERDPVYWNASTNS
jgi:hypothetical protein